jgi:S1-C subfamily serine protease
MSRWTALPAVCLLLLPVVTLAEENVYNKAVKSTVWIVQPIEGNKIRMGSGSLIDAQKRYILTNHHVVADKKEVTVMFPLVEKGKVLQDRDTYMSRLRSGQGIPGKVLFTEPSKDIAIIQLDSKAPIPPGTLSIKLSRESPGPGDKVHSIGSPGVSAGLFNYTGGDVKAVAHKKYRTGAGPNDPNSFTVDARVIETSSATNKGDSGGPLLNDKAELVGVTQGMLSGGDDTRPISLFIDVSEVRDVLKAHKISVSSAPATVASAESPSSTKPAAEKPAATPAEKPVNTAADSAKEKRKLEQTAADRLNGAKLFLNSNKKEAKKQLQQIVEEFPGTEAAGEAKKLLDTLK